MNGDMLFSDLVTIESSMGWQLAGFSLVVE